jgi:hypothetical protein
MGAPQDGFSQNALGGQSALLEHPGGPPPTPWPPDPPAPPDAEGSRATTTSSTLHADASATIKATALAKR